MPKTEYAKMVSIMKKIENEIAKKKEENVKNRAKKPLKSKESKEMLEAD